MTILSVTFDVTDVFYIITYVEGEMFTLRSSYCIEERFFIWLGEEVCWWRWFDWKRGYVV